MGYSFGNYYAFREAKVNRSKPRRLNRSIKRLPLTFVDAAPDPLANAQPNKSPEVSLASELKALKSGIQQRIAKDNDRRRAAGDADDHFVMVFETGQQAAVFLRAIGYQWPEEAYVDGTIVADILGIELPAAPTKPRQLKKIHDQSLTRLVNRRL